MPADIVLRNLKSFENVVFAMRREGFRVVEIAQAFGVVRGTVYKWFRNAAASSEEHVTAGGQSGVPGGKLTPELETTIRSLIIDKNP